MTYQVRIKRIFAGIMAFLMVCLFVVPENNISAKDLFLSNYQQIVYNQQNGLGSSEINCLYQSSSGYVWLGTDGGLYRSKGSEFQTINLWDTERADVYIITCITQDSHGRMWIGTENYGLFIIENGETIHFQDEYYEGIKKINSICENSDGEIFVATAHGLFTFEIGDGNDYTLEKYSDEAVAGVIFSKIVAFEDDIWALSGNNSIYVLGKDSHKGIINTTDITADDLNSMSYVDGHIYVGCVGREIISFKSATDYEILSAGVEGINIVMLDSYNRLWVGADSGVGYFTDSGFVKLEECSVDSYISDIIQDYEGNYWFASTRMGVVLLSRNKFRDFNMLTGMPQRMVNTVYTDNDFRYVGTEDGLLIYDSKNNLVSNEVSEFFEDVSIRHIMGDSDGNMWVSTYRRYGLVKIAPNEEISYYGRTAGLPSYVTSYAIELKNGNIAVATDRGIGILDKAGNVLKVYSEEDGIKNTNISCLYQFDDKTLLVGTDGNGIYTIDLNNGKVSNSTNDDGLNSNNISSIIAGKEGLWIGTDNGVCFYNESYRAISNIEYTNNIYDILLDEDKVYLIGSMGILITSESELLGSQGIEGRYYDINDGLSKTLNAISNSEIDKNGRLYLCCNTGICTLDTAKIPSNSTPPKMKVTAIDVDGTTYEFDDLAGSLKVDSDATRITIDFAVFSYTNRNNIQVEYYLEGFDEEPIIINGNDPMRAVYTNLDGGVYEFVISAYNGDGTESEEAVSFVIEKKKSFFERKRAKLLIAAVIFIVILIVVLILIKVLKILKSKNTALEKLSKEHEQAIKSSSAKNDYLANMSNEIKTPINAMVTRADELLKITSPDDERSEIIRNIYDTGNDIIEKVDDIILLAKIEAEKVSVVNTPYSVSQLIYDLSENAVAQIGDRPIKFFVEMGDDTQENLVGDIDKIKDILSRLIENALKYTKEGSITLSVDCYAYNDKNHQDVVNVIYGVADTGIGIQDTRIENIFEVSNIADNVKNSNSGIGVGLAIAKGYANLMEAELEAESVYGAGSTFTLALNQKISSNSSAVSMMTKIEGRVSKEEAEKLWLPEVTVLLVDDDDVSREVAEKVLKKFDIKVDFATSGLSSIDMVLNNSYDVVFMDLSMPVMNGTDAMKEIRELNGEEYSYLPIIAMESDAIEENKDELLGAGFTDSLLKPVEIRRVAAILKDCLPQSKLKEKTNDMEIYIEESRFSDGLEKLKPLLDVEIALEKIGGSIEVYNKLITIFHNQNINAVKELKEKYGKDVRGFKTKIHSIKTNSINIGATILAQETAKMEAAINIGNRDYVKDNIENVTEHLSDILALIEEYQLFVETVSGMSDEEYRRNKRIIEADSNTSKENTVEENIQEDNKDETKAQSIDIIRLENIKYTALDGEYDAVKEELAILEQVEYVGEDKEFMDVLKKAIANEETSVIDELITTYIDLKM